MKITFIDKPYHNNQTLIKKIEKLGSVKIYEDVPSDEEIIQRLNDTDIAIVEQAFITKYILHQVVRIKAIIVGSTALDIVDTYTAKLKGINIYNVPNYATDSVCEHIIMMCLLLSRNYHQQEKQNLYDENKLIKRNELLSTELSKKTLGIIGLGNIGSKLAKLAQAFEMNVIYHSSSNQTIKYGKSEKIHNLLALSDFVVICLAFNDSTFRYLNQDKLKYLKKNSFLINISSPKILDEKSIIELIKNGTLKGASFEEFESKDIQSFNNVIITCNNAWKTDESLNRYDEILFEVIRNALNENALEAI